MKACLVFVLLALLGTVAAFHKVAPEVDDISLPAATHVSALRGGKLPWNAPFRGMVCQLPPHTGPCKAAFWRFYYNAAEGVCQPFLYGGCQSNGNNFETIEQCKQACGD
ncbi:tauPI-stichotoxin-Hcr2d-like [Haemaphysalis longicornis]